MTGINGLDSKSSLKKDFIKGKIRNPPVLAFKCESVRWLLHLHNDYYANAAEAESDIIRKK